jgi:hypothetical protein
MNSKKSLKTKKTIGRNELIDLPTLKLKDLKAKIDTGAFTSAIHCHSINIKKINGKKTLVFSVLDPSHLQYAKKSFKFTKFKEARIKNSFGDTEKRYVVDISLKIFKENIKTEFSLTDRSKMKYPILLGRKFLKNGFIVDVNKINLSKKENSK